MKRLSKSAVLLMLIGGTMFGTSCTADFRDAVVAGAFDFVTGTTIDVLTALSPIDELAAQ